MSRKHSKVKEDRVIVDEGDCPYCHHHKVLTSGNFTKCARCKKII